MAFSLDLDFRRVLTLSLFLSGVAASVLSSPSALAQTQGENPLQVQAKLSSFDLEGGQTGQLEMELKLPDGYKAYLDAFHLEPDFPSGLKSGPFKLDPVKEFYDDFSKKQRQGMIGTAKMVAPFEMPHEIPVGDQIIRFQLTYQACTKTYCLFPKTVPVELHYRGIAAAKASTAAADEPHWLSFSAESFAARGLALSFLIVFIAGFLTSLTPCVFPMIPITLAVLGRDAHARGRGQQVLVSLLYVLGIALTYSLLGVLAASTGALFGSFMSSPYVLGAVCALFVAMALSMFGLYELQAPAFIRNKFAGTQQTGYLGVFVTGAFSGIVASPCVGPVLVGILAYVAKTQNLLLGFSLLFVFAVGMGMLFLIIGMSAQATKLLPRSGAWMENVKYFFGVLMLGAAFYFLDFLVSRPVVVVLIGGAMLLLGYFGGALKPARNRAEIIKKGLCHLAMTLGLATIAYGIILKTQPATVATKTVDGAKAEKEWHPYSDELMAKALADGKPVLLDFYADWCGACKEMEHKTFPQPEFQAAAERFTLVRFDATNDSPKLEEFRQRFDIIGLPTVVFIDSKGNWVKELTVVAFQDAAYFAERMKQVQ